MPLLRSFGALGGDVNYKYVAPTELRRGRNHVEFTSSLASWGRGRFGNPHGPGLDSCPTACRSYGAWGCCGDVTINMALLWSWGVVGEGRGGSRGQKSEVAVRGGLRVWREGRAAGRRPALRGKAVEGWQRHWLTRSPRRWRLRGRLVGAAKHLQRWIGRPKACRSYGAWAALMCLCYKHGAPPEPRSGGDAAQTLWGLTVLLAPRFSHARWLDNCLT